MHRWVLAASVALPTLMICYHVMAFNTEGGGAARGFVAEAFVGPMMAFEVLWAVAEDATMTIAREDFLAQGTPVGSIVGV